MTFYEYGTEFVEWLPIDPETGRVRPQRLKPGIYNATTWLDVAGSGGPDSAGVALLGEPHLVVDADKKLVLDARKAKRVTVKTPHPSEDRYRRMQYHHTPASAGRSRPSPTPSSTAHRLAAQQRVGPAIGA